MQINILEGRAGYVMGRVYHFIFIRLSDNRNSKYNNANSFIENLAASNYSMWAQRGKQM